MIWFLLIATGLVMAAFLFGPLFGGKENKAIWPILGAASLASLLGIFGLYAWKGQPELTGKHAGNLKAQYYYSQGLLSQSIAAYENLIFLYPDDAGLKAEYDQVKLELSRVPREELKIIQTVAELKLRLYQDGSDNPDEWRLLANSQMKLGDHDGALKSFERALKIDPENPDIEDDYNRAINFINAQKQAQEMTPEDRQAMINNMVSGLAARLKENGGTAEEWKRLIKARQVQGQDELLAEEIDIMKRQLQDSPELIQQILGTGN